jgi:fructokinase
MSASMTREAVMVEGGGFLYGAIELGGTKALCAVGTRASLVAETRIPTTLPEQTLAAVESFFAPYRAQLGAVGVASFGPLELDAGSATYGALLHTPKPGWSGVSLVARLATRLGVPVVIDTDVNAAALAEHRLGAGEGHDPCVYVTVGTGIGVGVCIDGRPLHGLLHPELGHLPAPPLCDFVGSCPFHGRCIEGVASAPALSMRTGLTPDALPDDHPVWMLEAQYLAHLLAACVLAYAPRRIILSGGVLARRGLLDGVRSALSAQLASYVPRSELSAAGVVDYVRPAHFGQRAGLMGALLLAYEACPSAR